MSKRVLITGAGSGFGRGAALELARRGHQVIAGVQIAPQATELMSEAAEAGVVDALVRIEEEDSSRFRNVVPDEIVPWIQAIQTNAWNAGEDDALFIAPSTLA